MNSDWHQCKNILCIRPDNMGDLIMSGPAIRALKESFDTKITVLTSSMGAGIAKHMAGIDEIMIGDMPWVKSAITADPSVFNRVVDEIKQNRFDGAVTFTVYSQNPLPTVMLAYLAGIPRRLAYCRENPYHLLTDCVPDQEPYTLIKHQVQRDLDLVASIGAFTENSRLSITVNNELNIPVINKLVYAGFDIQKKWMLLHTGVSEVKRQYPAYNWIVIAKKIISELGYQVVFTGADTEKRLTDQLAEQTGEGSISAGGLFNLDELITLISLSPMLISVNTGTVHIAAATGTPVIVLYALTNPQHTPWQVPHAVLPYSVDEQLLSKNEVIRFVHQRLYKENVPLPGAEEIMNEINKLLKAEADLKPV